MALQHIKKKKLLLGNFLDKLAATNTMKHLENISMNM